MQFHFYVNQSHFHQNGFALSQTLFETGTRELGNGLLMSYSWYWTGTSLKWRLVGEYQGHILGIGLEPACNGGSRENIIKKRSTSVAFEKIPQTSLSCKLVPVLYQEYVRGLSLTIKERKFSGRKKIQSSPPHPPVLR